MHDLPHLQSWSYYFHNHPPSREWPFSDSLWFAVESTKIHETLSGDWLWCFKCPYKKSKQLGTIWRRYSWKCVRRNRLKRPPRREGKRVTWPTDGADEIDGFETRSAICDDMWLCWVSPAQMGHKRNRWLQHCGRAQFIRWGTTTEELIL